MSDSTTPYYVPADELAGGNSTFPPYVAFDVTYIPIPASITLIAMVGNAVLFYVLLTEKGLIASMPFVPWIYNSVIADLVLSYIILPWAMLVQFDIPSIVNVCLWSCRSVLVSVAIVLLSVLSWSLLFNTIHRLICIKAFVNGDNETIMNGGLQKRGPVLCILIWLGSCVIGAFANTCSNSNRDPVIIGAWVCTDTVIPVVFAWFIVPISFSVYMTAWAKFWIWRNRAKLLNTVNVVKPRQICKPRFNSMLDRLKKTSNLLSNNIPYDETESIKIAERRANNALHFNITLFCSTIMLIIAWLPFASVMILVANEQPLRPGFSRIDTKPEVVCLWLGFLSSALYPIIYGATWVEFRQVLNRRWNECRGYSDIDTVNSEGSLTPAGTVRDDYSRTDQLSPNCTC